MNRFFTHFKARTLAWALLVILLPPFTLTAYDGIMAGESDLRIISTKHFDIIFPERSRKTAALLYEQADAIYAETAEKYTLPHDFRLPVVISPSQETFNAYFSFAPFNHIVMRDAAPDSGMAVFSETFVSVFRHELTHAISYNMHNDFWFGVKETLGDSYNPGILTVTTAWAEGAAVSSESDGGEGRLNDEYSRHFIKQAKIEGKFPRYSEINGTKDVYPYAMQSYYFGGAFSAWLQKEYGREKYAQFWYKCVNFQTLTYFMCFRQVYGIPIKEAWAKFYASLAVPDVPASPLEHAWCAPVCADLAYYGGLTAYRAGFAFFDAYSASVRFSAIGSQKAKLLFRQPAISRINFCDDGRFLAVSYTSAAGSAAKRKVRIFDMNTRRFFSVKEDALRDAAVFRAGGTYYLAAVYTQNQNASIKLYALELHAAGKIRALRFVDEIKNETQQFVYAPTGGTDGTLSFIHKNGLSFSILSYNLAEKSITEYRLPYERAVIRDLSEMEDGTLLFSWTKPGSMPRLGLLRRSGTDGGAFFLQAEDCSGGIFSPVPIDGKRAFYIGSFFDGAAVFSADIERMQMLEERAVAAPVSASEAAFAGGNAQTAASDSTPVSAAAKNFPGEQKFSLLTFALRQKGTVIPFSLTATHTISPSGAALADVSLPFGLTYVTASPWTLPVLGISAGYNPLTNSAAVGAFVYGGTVTDLLKYNVKAESEFDSGGYKQTASAANLALKLPAGRTGYVRFEGDAQFLEGRQSMLGLRAFLNHDRSFQIFDLVGSMESKDKRSRLFAAASASAAVGNIRRAGREHYEQSGVQLSAAYKTSYCAPLNGLEAARTYRQNMSVGATFKAARLLPVKNAPGMTYNLPLSAVCALFPAPDAVASAAASLVLFSKEIQAAPNFLPLFYTNRFTLRTYYTAQWSNGINGDWAIKDTVKILTSARESLSYSDECGLTAAFFLTPNIGGAANTALRFSLEATVKYRPIPQAGRRPFALDILGVTLF